MLSLAVLLASVLSLGLNLELNPNSLAELIDRLF